MELKRINLKETGLKIYKCATEKNLSTRKIADILGVNNVAMYREIYNKAIDDAIEYFIEHAHEVYDHISARDFICDRLEQLKEQKK